MFFFSLARCECRDGSSEYPEDVEVAGRNVVRFAATGPCEPQRSVQLLGDRFDKCDV